MTAGSCSQSGRSIRSRSRTCSRSARTLNAVAASSTRSAPSIGRPLGAVDGGEAAEQVGPPALDPGAEHDLTVAARAPRARGTRAAAPVLSPAHSCGSAQPFPHAHGPRRCGPQVAHRKVPEVVIMTMSSETSARGLRHASPRRPRPPASPWRRCVRRRGPVPRWWRDASVAAGWLVLLVVTALWVERRRHPGPHVGLRRPDVGRSAHRPDRLRAAAHPGVPHGARAVGRAGLGAGRARPHPPAGRLHVVQPHARRTSCSSPSGYAAATSEGIVGTIVDFVAATTRACCWRVAGTAALVMVVVTSVKKARKRLRYESWHLIHLYGYLGAGLALPHQLWTGTDFLASTTATVFWWSLYVVCAGAVLVFRVGLPLWRSLRAPLRVLDVRAEGPGRTTVTVGGRRRAPDAGARRSVLPVALPRRSGLDPRQPLLHLRRPRRPDPAVHRGPRRRRVRAARRRCDPAPGCSSKAPTAACTPGSALHRKVLLMGSGHRHHPDARPARGARPGPRRRHRRAPGAVAARCRARRRDRGARRGSWRPVPAHRRAPRARTATAGCPPRPATSPTCRRCARSCPTSPTTTSTSAARTAG